MKKLIRKVLGCLVVFIGIVGLFIPIVPGTIIIFSGIALINKGFYKKVVKKLKGWRK